MSASTAQQVAAYRDRYRDLAQRIAEVGFISAGSITRRYTKCASPNCRCRADPPRPHGPYWQWTAKVDGKTITRRLRPTEADLYQQWIDNDRELRSLIDQMRQVAAKATDLLLQEAKTQQRSEV